MIGVLLVGPEIAGMPALQVTSELLRIGDLHGIDLTPLVGPDVTLARVVDRLDRQSYDVLLWSGHGMASRMLTSDGGASPSWLAIQLARHDVQLAVLAACESGLRPETQALSLGFQDVLPGRGVNLVAMTQAVADKAAVEYNVALMQALEAGASIRQAHETGLEAAALAGNAAAPQLFVADNTMTTYQTTNTDNQLLRTMSDKIDRLGEQTGDIKTRQAVLEADLRRLMDDMGNIKHEVHELRRGVVNLPKAYVGIVVAIMLIVLLALIAVTWRIL